MNIKREIFITQAVKKTSAYLSRVFGKITKGQEKFPLDIVSQADKEAGKILIKQISRQFPNDGIFGEDLFGVEKKSKNNFCWVVDPLDGTHNFLTGLKEFGTLLALEKDGEIILSACCFPERKEFFFAKKGGGAFLNNKKIKVSETSFLRGQIVCLSGIFRKEPKKVLSDIKNFGEQGSKFRVYGTDAFAFTRVAFGSAIVATNRFCHPWDVAAPSLIVEEAGGKITDKDGKVWSIDSKNLIATNGFVHKKSLEIFKRS